MEPTTLTLSEQIDRARDGRSQKWIISKLNEAGIKMSDTQFSRKKISEYPDIFTDDELRALSLILNTKLHK